MNLEIGFGLFTRVFYTNKSPIASTRLEHCSQTTETFHSKMTIIYPESFLVQLQERANVIRCGEKLL